jgi:hypothetical protein
MDPGFSPGQRKRKLPIFHLCLNTCLATFAQPTLRTGYSGPTRQLEYVHVAATRRYRSHAIAIGRDEYLLVCTWPCG